MKVRIGILRGKTGAYVMGGAEGDPASSETELRRALLELAGFPRRGTYTLEFLVQDSAGGAQAEPSRASDVLRRAAASRPMRICGCAGRGRHRRDCPEMAARGAARVVPEPPPHDEPPVVPKVITAPAVPEPRTRLMPMADEMPLHQVEQVRKAAPVLRPGTDFDPEHVRGEVPAVQQQAGRVLARKKER